jgi:hypothetical protein
MRNDELKLKYISSSFVKKEKIIYFSKTYQGFVLNPFDIIYYHLDLDDNLLIMMAISISINYYNIYENNIQYQIILIPFFHGKNIFYVKRKQLRWNLMRKIF